MRKNIKVLNLDKQFIPIFENEIEYDLFKFSGGEVHLKLNLNDLDIDKVIITHRIKSSDDLMAIIQAKDILDNMRIPEIELFIPYLPYARQDRRCVKNETFSLKLFANIINSLNFNRVTSINVHSNISIALINNFENLNPINYITSAVNSIKILNAQKEILLISPDAGIHKTNKELMNYNLFSDIVLCDKTRNVNDGKLTNFKVFSDNLEGKDCLIVDDICDGGRTFEGIAKELKNKNAGDIYLYVTHGIFSAGFEKLNNIFKKIYSTNSFSNINNNILVQYEVNYNEN